MGRIFEARHLRIPDRLVAVKVLGEEFVREPEIVARFEREVESISRVAHPHVIEIYDAGKTAEGVHFLVTELTHDLVRVREDPTNPRVGSQRGAA